MEPSNSSCQPDSAWQELLEAHLVKTLAKKSVSVLILLNVAQSFPLRHFSSRMRSSHVYIFIV